MLSFFLGGGANFHWLCHEGRDLGVVSKMGHLSLVANHPHICCDSMILVSHFSKWISFVSEH